MPAGVRHADFRVLPDGAARRPRDPRRGRPAAADVVNEIVRIAADGSEVLVSGPDFVSDPRLAPDGVTLSWLQWDHPNMPWDAAQLVVRAADGTEHVLAGGPGRVRRPAGLGRGPGAVVVQRPDRLLVAVPRSGRTGRPSSSLDVGSDIAGPQWVFGQSRFALLADGRVAFAYGRDGADRLAVLEPDGERARARRALQRRSGTSRRRARRSSASPAARRSEPVVLRVDVDGGEPEILPPGPRPRPGPGLVLPAGARDLPDRGPRHRHRRRARAGLPADQPRGVTRPTATCRR